MTVRVLWEWGEDPQLIVDRADEGLVVRAHPSLSEQQVRQACEHLGDEGDRVYEAWAQASGLNS